MYSVAVAAKFNSPSMTASAKICKIRVGIARNSSCVPVLGLLFMPQCSEACAL